MWQERNYTILESVTEKLENVWGERYTYICSGLQEKKDFKNVQRKMFFIPCLNDSSWRMEKYGDKNLILQSQDTEIKGEDLHVWDDCSLSKNLLNVVMSSDFKGKCIWQGIWWNFQHHITDLRLAGSNLDDLKRN